MCLVTFSFPLQEESLFLFIPHRPSFFDYFLFKFLEAFSLLSFSPPLCEKVSLWRVDWTPAEALSFFVRPPSDVAPKFSFLINFPPLARSCSEGHDRTWSQEGID